MSVVVEAVALRSGTTADWAAVTAPILGVGEQGVDTTTGTVKMGDGVTAFPTLAASVLRVKSSGRATLVAGTKVVADVHVDADDNILLTAQTLGTVTAPSALTVSARVADTSFTILASQNTDTSIIYYQIIG